MSTAWTEGVELPDGALHFDPGNPPPETVPPGYRLDPTDPWTFRLAVEPGPCADRESRACVHGRKRSYCRRREVYATPAACCRCQGRLETLG